MASCKQLGETDFWKAYGEADFKQGWYKGIEVPYSSLDDHELDGTIIEDSHFTSATLKRSSWDDSKLYNIVFEDCIIDNASFQRVKAQNLTFKGCSLNNVDFTSADITNLVLMECEGRVFFESAHLIQKTNFTKCDLRKSDFSNSSLVLAEFTNCILKGAAFDGAELAHADFTECDITDSTIAKARGLSIKRTLPIFHKSIISPTAVYDHQGLLNGLLKNRVPGSAQKPAWQSTIVNYNSIAHLLCSDEVELNGEDQKS